MNLSVIICTWNRAELLDRTLTSMHELHVPEGVSWELIVVNNNCTDHTSEIIEKHSTELPIVSVFEKTSGQSHARNAALQIATGELLVWTDDDVIVSPHWIDHYIQAVNDWPDAAYFGGTVDPIFEIPPPSWIKPHLKDLSAMLAIQQYGNQISKFPSDDIPRGVNMAIPQKIFEQFCFDGRLGISENNNLRGEDADLLRRMQAAGFDGVWVGPARVQHWVPKERLTKSYIQKWYYGSGRSSTLRKGLKDCKWSFGVPRWVLKKYITSKFTSLLKSRTRGDEWRQAFTQTAFLKGMLDQARETGPAVLKEIHRNSTQ